MKNSLTDAAKEYLGLKKDAVKLGLVENLSLLFNRFLSLFVLICVMLVALVFIASACNQWLGDALSNKVAASFITGGFFLVAFLLLFIFRKKLFVNGFVALFSKMFFEEKEEPTDPEV